MKIRGKFPEILFANMDDIDKFIFLITHAWRYLANYMLDAWTSRKSKITK
jgi:hypothetical protein